MSTAVPPVGETHEIGGEVSADASQRRLSDEQVKWIIRVVSLVIVLGGWEVVGSRVNPIFLSTPSRVVVAFVELIRNGQLFEAMRISVLGIVIGFGAAVVLGIPIGIMMGRSRFVEAAIDPYMALRDAYSQYRQKKVEERRGKPAPPKPGGVR